MSKLLMDEYIEINDHALLWKHRLKLFNSDNIIYIAQDYHPRLRFKIWTKDIDYEN